MTESGRHRGSTTAELGLAASGLPLEARIRAATLRCVARWGISKTTLDDVAREAGCSRATIYRAFPGGKDVLMMAAFAAEVSAFFERLAGAIARVDTLEDLLVVAVSSSCREIAEHDALQYLLTHEPEAVLPYLSFDGLDPLLDWARGFAVPQLARFLPAREAAELGEWVARLVVSYAFETDPALAVDLSAEPVARDFLRTYVLPGVDRMTAAAPIVSTESPTVSTDPSLSTDPTTTEDPTITLA